MEEAQEVPGRLAHTASPRDDAVHPEEARAGLEERGHADSTWICVNGLQTGRSVYHAFGIRGYDDVRTGCGRNLMSSCSHWDSHVRQQPGTQTGPPSTRTAPSAPACTSGTAGSGPPPPPP